MAKKAQEEDEALEEGEEVDEDPAVRAARLAEEASEKAERERREADRQAAEEEHSGKTQTGIESIAKGQEKFVAVTFSVLGFVFNLVFLGIVVEQVRQHVVWYSSSCSSS